MKTCIIVLTLRQSKQENFHKTNADTIILLAQEKNKTGHNSLSAVSTLKTKLRMDNFSILLVFKPFLMAQNTRKQGEKK